MSSKTIKQVKTENPKFSKLISSVVRQLGGTHCMDNIRNYGISGGFTGFIYYSETVNFAQRNRKQIVELLEESAEQSGEDVVNMVANFGIFRSNPMDSEDKKDLYRYLSGCKCKETTIPNLMAWFAAEEVARMFEK
jgi:hypothetical protein